jgi:hypothetical protein
MIDFRVSVVVGAASLLVLASANAQEPVSSDPRPIEEEEAYAVYAVVLRNEHWKAYVVQAESDLMQPCVSSGAEFDRWRDVVEDFLFENEERRLLLPRPPLVEPYRIVPAAAIASSLHELEGPPDVTAGAHSWQGPWSGFYERFPRSGGYTKLSAVGFDSAKQRAMVYVAHYCGMLCGGGKNHLLEKQGGVWREVVSSEVAGCLWMN